MTTWTTIATSPNFCASKSCKNVCDSNPQCTYLSVDGGDGDDDILYGRGKDGKLIPGVPTPGPNGPSPPSGPQSPAFDLMVIVFSSVLLTSSALNPGTRALILLGISRPS